MPLVISKIELTNLDKWDKWDKLDRNDRAIMDTYVNSHLKQVIIRCASTSYKDTSLRCHSLLLRNLTKAVNLVKPFTEMSNSRRVISGLLADMVADGYLYITPNKPQIAKFDMHHDFIASHIFVSSNGDPWKWVKYTEDSHNLRGWLARHSISA